jgi:hypothetical protein
MYLIKLSKLIVLTAFILCIWTGYEIWVSPIEYRGVETVDSINGAVIEKNVVRFKKFSEVSGFGVVPLLVPVAIVFLAIWAAFTLRSIVLVSSLFLILIFWIITGFSIGMAYLPIVILLIITSIVNLTGKWLANKARS